MVRKLTCRDCADWRCDDAERLPTDDASECDLFRPHEHVYNIENSKGDLPGDLIFRRWGNELTYQIVKSYTEDGHCYHVDKEEKRFGKLDEKTRDRIATEFCKFCGVDERENGWVSSDIHSVCDMAQESGWWIKSKRWVDKESKTDSRDSVSGVGAYFNDEGKFVPAALSEAVRKKYVFKTLPYEKGDLIRVYHPELGYYINFGKQKIQKFCQGELGEYSSERRIREVVFHVAVSTRVNPDAFDMHEGCINLRNGYYNLYTGELHPHTPDKMFTSAMPFSYDPNAKCTNFDSFLDDIRVNKQLIYEIFGYCLVPGYPIHSIIGFIGDGGNGKGTTMRVLTKFIGTENIVSHSLQAFSKDTYALGDLYGKMVNLCGDMPAKLVDDTALFKAATGEDMITGRKIYQGNHRFYNRAKMIFSVNTMPKFNDDTDSLYRRMIFEEFNVHVDGRDLDFDENKMKTDEELSGIFNECIKVLPFLLARGKFCTQRSVHEMREYMQQKSDPMLVYIDDCLYDAENHSEPCSDVYAAYLRWCTENHITAKNNRTFGKDLKKAWSEKLTRYRDRTKGDEVYVYLRMQLKNKYAGLDVMKELERYELSRLSHEESSDLCNDLCNKSVFQCTDDTIADNCPKKLPLFKDEEQKEIIGHTNVDNSVTDVCIGDTYVDFIGQKHVKGLIDDEKTEILHRTLIGQSANYIGHKPQKTKRSYKSNKSDDSSDRSFEKKRLEIVQFCREWENKHRVSINSSNVTEAVMDFKRPGYDFQFVKEVMQDYAKTTKDSRAIANRMVGM